MIIGSHQSAAGGPHTAIERAERDDCAALQLFTKNNNRWKQRMWSMEEAQKFQIAFAESDLRALISHTAYLINLCSTTPEVREKSGEALADELDRCQLLGIQYLVLHPGSPGERGEEWGLDTIAEQINDLYTRHDDCWHDVTMLLENTAGQGSSLGWRHEQLAALLDRLEQPHRFGVCFDTCHAHAAGYDLRTRERYDEYWRTFDEVVGLDRLQVFHLNDSQGELGSRVDRHDHIGEGEIGESVFRFLVNDARFAEVPAVVETPAFEDGTKSFAHNVSVLRSYVD